MGQHKKKLDLLKKVVVVLFSLVFISSFAVGCGSSLSTNNGKTESSKVNEVVQSIKGETATEKGFAAEYIPEPGNAGVVQIYLIFPVTFQPGFRKSSEDFQFYKLGI